MPTLTDDDQKSRIDEGYDHGGGSYNPSHLSEQETATLKGIEDNYDKNADPSQENDNIARVRDAESNWKTDVGSGGFNSNDLNKPKLQKALTFAKKRGGILGLIGLSGVGGGILAGFFGPASMLISMTENFSLSNDSSSTVLERRMMHVFGNMTKGGGNADPICANSSRNIKCKVGRISNSALRQLSRKGITPIQNGQAMNIGRTGYPSSNPTHYEINTGDRRGTIRVSAADMPGFLAQPQNRKLAAKVLGRSGAFNLRVKAWTGKHITNKLYKKFGISKSGGLADGTTRGGPVGQLLEQANQKLSQKIPGLDQLNQVQSKVSDKVTKHTDKAKKGGALYLIPVAGCIAVKAPGYIAAGVAGVQLLRVMPYFMEIIGSPGSKAKASGIGSGFTGEDMSMIGALLTNRTENGEGRMTSALDSPILLSALGVNKSKPAVSEKFTPGYSVVNGDLSGLVKVSQDFAEASEDACNVILSPAAMWTAFAINAGITATASATVIGGVAKLAADWVVGEIVEKLIESVASWGVEEIINRLAENDDLERAEGEELGDVIGISASAFFASGGMSRHLPTLTESQVVAFNQIKEENEAFHREMDIASLSPFDTSSRYTFLGSIVHNTRMAMLANGAYNNSLTSIFSNLLHLPSLALDPTAGALNFTDASCGYAEDFSLNTESPDTTPAISLSGLPCTGMTNDQINMDVNEAIDLLIEEGWICNPDIDTCPEIEDGMTIEDLMPKNEEDGYSGIGYIKNDNPLYEFINSCSNPDTGDYIFGSAGCTAPVTTNTVALAAAVMPANDARERICSDERMDTGEVDDEGNAITTEKCVDNLDMEGQDSEIDKNINPEALKAMSVFLVDYQIASIINGEDEGDINEDPQGLTTGTPEDVQPQGEGWTIKENTDYSSVPCASGSTLEDTYDHPVANSRFNLCKMDGTGIVVNSIASANVRAMIDAAAEDGVTLNGGGFRSVETQQDVYNRNCRNGVCNPPTARPGYSQHERGLAIDFSNCGTRSTRCYQWLNQNASKFQYYNLPSEPWHWSPSGY